MTKSEFWIQLKNSNLNHCFNCPVGDDYCNEDFKSCDFTLRRFYEIQVTEDNITGGSNV